MDVYKLPNFPSERNFGKSQYEINYFFSHSRIFPPNCHWDYIVTRKFFGNYEINVKKFI